MGLKLEISILLFTLLTIRFGISMADGMAISKAGWWKRHVTVWLGRDLPIAAIYLYLWECRSSNFLIVPICYALSLNWSLHIVAYWAGDQISDYKKGFSFSIFRIVTAIGSAITLLAGMGLAMLYFAVDVNQITTPVFWATMAAGAVAASVWGAAIILSDVVISGKR